MRDVTHRRLAPIIVEYYCFLIIIIVVVLETHRFSKVVYFLRNNHHFHIEKSKPSLFPRKTISRQKRALCCCNFFAIKTYDILTIPFFKKKKFSLKIMFCNKSNEILLFSPSWFRRRWPVDPRILQQVK